jgi:hypothetical protein
MRSPIDTPEGNQDEHAHAPTYDDVAQAAGRIAGVANRTPVHVERVPVRLTNINSGSEHLFDHRTE